MILLTRERQHLRAVRGSERILMSFDRGVLLMSRHIAFLLRPFPVAAEALALGAHKDGEVAVDLKPLEKNDPMSALQQTDNMVVFQTERYHDQPLVIRGPGAGAAVTASGVFSDLLRLITYIRM